jgi:glutaredoxin 2
MILFSAIWCPYCQKVKQFLESNPQFDVKICDVDSDWDTPTSYGVKQLPALATDTHTLLLESDAIIQFIKENA